MIRAALLGLLALIPAMASARAVPVQSGDHPGFARLVLTLGPGRAWALGRTEDGYALRLDPGEVAFDLARVYDLIGRNRLAAIAPDPAGRRLDLTVGCACHALPYELGGGVLVIDIRDGAPPPGSSFETSLEGRAMPPLLPIDRRRPRSRPMSALPPGGVYDWLAARDAPAAASSVPLRVEDALDALDAEGGADDRLRDGLLRQLAEGATRGVVRMALPAPRGRSDAPGDPLPQIRVGEDLGLIVLPGGAAHDPRATLTPEGAPCIADDALDFAGWMIFPDPATGLASARAGLVGEFDAPDPAALTRAVRYLLSIGFGAEARQLMRAFRTAAGSPDDARLRDALSYAVDGEVPPERRFAAMAGCDTAAALWAALETAGRDLPAGLNVDAAVRAFSALPPGLRRDLGSDLTARFLAAGDADAARALTEATLRLPGPEDPALRLGAARVEAALGDAADAEGEIAAVASGNGPAAADALVALTETRATSGAAMTGAQAATLAALAQEYRGTDREPALRRAAALALALTGDFDGAFAAARLALSARADLWRLLADQGPDAALLTQAVAADPAAVSAAAPEARRRIAGRLAALGLPDAALAWLPDGSPSEADRLALAEVHLDRRDGLSAMRVLDGLTDAGADALRARAESSLGDSDRAALAYGRAGDPASAGIEARRAGDWARVAGGDDPVWADAARLVGPEAASGLPDRPGRRKIAAAPTRPAAEGPLARGAALVSDSVVARAAIDALLAAVPTPDAPEGVTGPAAAAR